MATANVTPDDDGSWNVARTEQELRVLVLRAAARGKSAKEALQDVDIDREQLLLQACWAGNNNLASFLIDAGADVNAGTLDGDPPLALAAFNGHFGAVSLLVMMTADPNAAAAGRETVLTRAAAAGHRRIVASLVQASADADLPNQAGETPVTVAIRHNHG